MTFSIEDSTDTAPLPLVNTPSSVEGLLTDSSVERKRRGMRPAIIARVAGGAALALVLLNASSGIENVAASINLDERNNRTSEVASELIGLPVRVDCNDATLDFADTLRNFMHPNTTHIQTIGHVRPYSLGVATIPPQVMTVRESVCDDIASFEFDENASTDDEIVDRYLASADYAQAAYIVLHEGEHLRNVNDEAAAACYAMQKLPKALEQSGFNEKYVDMISQNTLRYVSELHPDEYYSEECAPGGELDLGISDLYLAKSNAVVFYKNTPSEEGVPSLSEQ